jgi:serine protease Do
MRLIWRHLGLLSTFLLVAAMSLSLRAEQASTTRPTTRAATRPAVSNVHPLAQFKTSLESVEDLRLLQKQVEAVAMRVAPTVVGLRVGDGQGSGVIISEDGYVLTAGHVASAPGRRVTIVLGDGKTVKATSLGINYGADSGLVKISDPPPGGGKWPVAEMGKSGELMKGEWCIAMGHPGGFKSGRTPPLRLGRVLDVRGSFIRTDCTLVGGDSGGPLFDLDGRVIGINSRIGNSLNDNRHVPVDTFEETWDRLAASEAFGIGYFVSRPGAPYLGIVENREAPDCRIADILPNSPAEKVGLVAGDLIVSFDRQKVANFGEMGLKLSGHEVGDEIQLEVKRGQETLKVKLVIGRQPRQ